MVLLSTRLLCFTFALLSFTFHSFLGLFPLSHHRLWLMGISGLLTLKKPSVAPSLLNSCSETVVTFIQVWS
ncbi:MAG: hypothetical protein J3Q66DRAFT_104706 [Benniella sp.]|nr:MAG: hypothetical protein J3Q66DRAFT_104706 [Benniella sp.]